MLRVGPLTYSTLSANARVYLPAGNIINLYQRLTTTQPRSQPRSFRSHAAAGSWQPIVYTSSQRQLTFTNDRYLQRLIRRGSLTQKGGGALILTGQYLQRQTTISDGSWAIATGSGAACSPADLDTLPCCYQ